MSSQKTTKAEDKRALTRERLIKAATQAIGEKGFDGVTLDQIAGRAGMTKGAIYDHFGSKDALFLAVMAQDARLMPFPQSEKSAPAKTRMRDFAQAVLEEGERTRLRVPLQAAFLLYSLAHPEIHTSQPARMAEYFSLEERRLGDAFAADELPMAPDRFTILLQAMIPGLMYLRSQAPDLVTDEAVADIFAGLLAKKPG